MLRGIHVVAGPGLEFLLQSKENPPIAFSAATGQASLSGTDWSLHWRVAYCKPRQEKAFAAQLIHLDITYFLPMVERESFSGGRRRRNMYPLFPSYVFFAGDENVRLMALKTERLVTLVAVPEAAQDQLRRELKSIDAALRASPNSIEFQTQSGHGSKVTYADGPLAGIEGVLVDGANGQRLWLGISAIGGGVTIRYAKWCGKCALLIQLAGHKTDFRFNIAGTVEALAAITTMTRSLQSRRVYVAGHTGMAGSCAGASARAAGRGTRGAIVGRA